MAAEPLSQQGELYASKVLAKLKPANDDQEVGIDIVRRALQAPVRQIAETARSQDSFTFTLSYVGAALVYSE